MEADSHTYSVDKRIRLLLVDDSELFRRFIAEILADNASISIVGEAVSGRQALELAVKSKPDVILLDMEMPGMDGMDTLKRLVAESFVPVIMISSLSREGSARSFDTLKHGAVDFLGKDALHPKKGMERLKKELVYRIICASKVRGKKAAGEFIPDSGGTADEAQQKRIIFCEECGTGNVFEAESEADSSGQHCRQCGDLLEAVVITKYRRVASIGVIGAGRGGAVNLLNIIPRLSRDYSGTTIAVMQEGLDYIDSFSRYLNAISDVKVIRLEEGMNIEGGNCYIASHFDNFNMVSRSTNCTIRKSTPAAGQGALDLMFESISSIMKNRMFALVLSGSQLDGDKGMQQVRKNQGYSAVLNAASCLCKELGENILKKCAIDRIVDEQDCVELLSAYQDANSLR